MKDVISGSGLRGDTYLFRGLGSGAYAAGVRLLGPDGRPARPGSSCALAIADWNLDGRLDLVAGNREGKVSLLAWVDDRDGLPVFDYPRRIALETTEPVPDGCDAAPLVVDWDRDGIDDLLVGYGYGAIVFHKGFVEGGVHRVATGEILLQPCYAQEPEELVQSELTGKLEPVVARSHKLPKLAAWDWNGDGRLDLLVGDHFSATGPEPVLTKEQREQRDALVKRLTKLGEERATAWRPLRQQAEAEAGPRATYRKVPEDWQEATDVRTAELAARSETCRAIDRAIAEASSKLEPLRSRQVAHGYVWVYLRKSESSPAAAAAR